MNEQFVSLSKARCPITGPFRSWGLLCSFVVATLFAFVHLLLLFFFLCPFTNQLGGYLDVVTVQVELWTNNHLLSEGWETPKCGRKMFADFRWITSSCLCLCVAVYVCFLQRYSFILSISHSVIFPLKEDLNLNLVWLRRGLIHSSGICGDTFVFFRRRLNSA